MASWKIIIYTKSEPALRKTLRQEISPIIVCFFFYKNQVYSGRMFFNILSFSMKHSYLLTAKTTPKFIILTDI